MGRTVAEPEYESWLLADVGRPDTAGDETRGGPAVASRPGIGLTPSTELTVPE